MAPDNAKIFWAEDDQKLLKTRTKFLEEAGHKVVITANSLESALSNIPDLKKSGINVAIVDGNLSGTGTSVKDGEKIAQEIKNQHPNIAVIGSATEDPIQAADVNCLKINGVSKLVEAVTQA